VTARLTSAGESGGRNSCCFGDVIGVTAGGGAFSRVFQREVPQAIRASYDIDT